MALYQERRQEKQTRTSNFRKIRTDMQDIKQKIKLAAVDHINIFS